MRCTSAIAVRLLWHAGLESLDLSTNRIVRLPPALAAGTGLRELSLAENSNLQLTDADVDIMLRLPRLRRLHLKYCPRVPACLGRLSQLEELHLYRLADAAGVDAALRPLTGLTSL